MMLIVDMLSALYYLSTSLSLQYQQVVINQSSAEQLCDAKVVNSFKIAGESQAWLMKCKSEDVL